MSQYPQYPQYPQGQSPYDPQRGYAPQQPNVGYYAPGPYDPRYGYGMQPMKSGLGLASFIIGCIASLVLVGLIIFAAVLAAQSGGQPNSESPEMMFAGCTMLLALGANVLGAIFGLINVFQRDRKKLWGILGLVLNGGMIVIVLALMVIGLAARA